MKSEALKSPRTFWKVSTPLLFLVAGFFFAAAPASAAELLGHDLDGTNYWELGASNSAGAHAHETTFTPDGTWTITTFGVWLARSYNDNLTDNTLIEICSFEFQANSSDMCDEVLATGTVANNTLTNDLTYYQLDFDQDVQTVEGTRYVVRFRRTGANNATETPLLGKSADAPDNSNNYGDPGYPGDADVGHDYLGGYYIWDWNYSQVMPAYDLFGTIGLPHLNVTVSATNTPASAGGIRWSGYGTLPSDPLFQAGEYTTNFFTRIFNTSGYSQTYTANSSSSTAPGYYETPAGALGVSWPPGSYTVVTTQETTLRTTSATTTVTVVPYIGSGGGLGGGGGGSWGDEGVPPTVPPAPIFHQPQMTSYTDCLELSLSAFGCFLNTTVTNIEGLPLIGFISDMPINIAYVTNAATATVDLYIPIPASIAPGGVAGKIELFNSTSSTAGIMGAATAEFWNAVRSSETTALYILAGIGAILIINDFRKSL